MTPRLYKFLESVFLTLAIYGALGFIYIAGNAWFHPETLSWQLTHFVPFPREDTFGALCFITSMVSCFVYLLLRNNHRR